MKLAQLPTIKLYYIWYIESHEIGKNLDPYHGIEDLFFSRNKKLVPTIIV